MKISNKKKISRAVRNRQTVSTDPAGSSRAVRVWLRSDRAGHRRRPLDNAHRNLRPIGSVGAVWVEFRRLSNVWPGRRVKQWPTTRQSRWPRPKRRR